MHTSADGFVATEDGQMWPAFGWPPEPIPTRLVGVEPLGERCTIMRSAIESEFPSER